jgi:hypothetical protein
MGLVRIVIDYKVGASASLQAGKFRKYGYIYLYLDLFLANNTSDLASQEF